MTNKIFDDLILKESLGNVTFRLKAEKDISAWQATRFISDLNATYYKIELLDSIANALNEGFMPENIYILDSSLNISLVYAKMNVITDTTIDLLYTIGHPFSLIPSLGALNIRFIFRYFRCINEILRKYRLERNKRNELSFYIRYANEKSLDEAVNLLKSNTLKKIDDPQIYEKIKEELEKRSGIIEKKFASEKKLLNIEENNSFKEEKSFRYYFNQIKRPIIIAFDDDLKKGRVLCRNQLNRKAENTTTFNLKSVTHNSPYEFIITAGIAIAAFLLKEYRNYEKHLKDMEIKDQQIEINKKELSIKDVELEAAKLKLDKIKNDTQCIVPNINVYLGNNQIEKLENPAIKNQLRYLRNTLYDRYQNNSKQMKLKVDCLV